MKNYLFILFMLSVVFTNAQSTANVADLNGSVYRSRSGGSNISGNPFLLEDYHKGIIFLADGREIENVELKYDILADALIFKDDRMREIEITDPVSSFKIIDYDHESGRELERVFKSGFLQAGNNSDKSFYEILYNHREIIFAKKTKKNIVENMEYSSTVVTKTILLKENYFIIKDNKPQLISKTEKSVSQALDLDQKKLKGFLNQQKINVKNDEAIILILKNLDGLK